MTMMTIMLKKMFAPVLVCPAPFVHGERAMRGNYDGTSCEPLVTVQLRTFDYSTVLTVTNLWLHYNTFVDNIQYRTVKAKMFSTHFVYRNLCLQNSLVRDTLHTLKTTIDHSAEHTFG